MTTNIVQAQILARESQQARQEAAERQADAKALLTMQEDLKRMAERNKKLSNRLLREAARSLEVARKDQLQAAFRRAEKADALFQQAIDMATATATEDTV